MLAARSRGGAPAAYAGGVDLDALADICLPDVDGESHRLGDYWAERRVALVFLRHFG